MAPYALAALPFVSVSAQAAAVPVFDIPPGPVAAATIAIARQGGLNIGAADPRLLARRAPRIHGRMDAAEALVRLAAATGIKVTRVAPSSYLLSPAPAPIKRARVRTAAFRKPRPTAPATAPLASQEIIVSASKRDVTLAHLAGAWQMIRGRKFAPLGVAGAEAIEARSVGFSSTHLGAGRNKLFIRGIADSSFSGPTQSTVGQYLGDLRTAYSGPDPDLKLVDMQSVEILEGPQGTLYGAGALGGILLLKPNMPVFGGWSGVVAAGISATWHGDPGADLSGVLNAPIASSAALRLVGYRSHEGGYIDNLVTGQDDINSVDVRGARATLSMRPASDWFVDLSGVAQRIAGADSQYADRGGPRLTRDSLVNQPFSSDFDLASLVVRKDRGTIRLRATSGASWQDVAETYDVSLPGEPRRLHQRSRARALDNELRLWRPMSGGFSWLFGVSSIVHRYSIERQVESGSSCADLPGSENRVRETTVYGEAGLELLRDVELSFGGRYTHASLTSSGKHLDAPIAALLATVHARRTEQRFMPALAVVARPITGLSLYARYQQGFRPGGLSVAADSARYYQSDRLGTFETGFRYGSPGRGRFDVEGSASASRWTDIQADFLDASGLPVTDNIGNGRVWTLSANAGLQLADGLRLEGGIAWNDGRITGPTAFYRMLASAEGAGAMEIPNIARVAGRGAIDWRTRIDGRWSLAANAYARFMGSSRLGIGPRLGEEQGDYVDTGLVLRLSEANRAISLSATNLMDSVGNRFAFGAPLATGADLITPLRPRTVRLGLEQSF